MPTLQEKIDLLPPGKYFFWTEEDEHQPGLATYDIMDYVRFRGEDAPTKARSRDLAFMGAINVNASSSAGTS